MYNENASMGKRRRENRKRVAEYTRKKAYEPARKKYVDDNVKSTEETDYFEKVKTLEVEEKVNTEAEVQNEEEKEVYNKIRAWREITDKEEKKEEPVMVNTTESDVNQKEPGIEVKNFKSYDKELPEEDIAKMYQKALDTVTEPEDGVFEDISEVADIVENSDYIVDHVDEMINEIEDDSLMKVVDFNQQNATNYEPTPDVEYTVDGESVEKEEFYEAVESTPVETDGNPNVEAVYLGAVMNKEELYTDMVKDVLETQVYNSTNKIGYVWVVNEASMYYHTGYEWVKEESKDEEVEEPVKVKAEEFDDAYQFVYEPETEEDDDEDIGYTSLITEAGEELSEDKLESLDGVANSDIVNEVYKEALNELAEKSKGYKIQNEAEDTMTVDDNLNELYDDEFKLDHKDEDEDEFKFVDLEDIEIPELEPIKAEDLPTLEEIYADIDEDDFVIEENKTDYKEELEKDTEDYEDDDVEVWDDEFEDEDIETVVEDDDNKEFVTMDDIELPFFDDDEDDEDDDVEVWDDEFEDEDIETIVEDGYIDLDDLADYEETFEDVYFEDDFEDEEMYGTSTLEDPQNNDEKDSVVFLEDDFNNDLNVEAFTKEGEALPYKMVKEDVDKDANIEQSLLYLETLYDSGYSVTDLISIIKYVLLRLNDTVDTTRKDDVILTNVLKSLAEAQLWLDKWL